MGTRVCVSMRESLLPQETLSMGSFVCVDVMVLSPTLLSRLKSYRNFNMAFVVKWRTTTRLSPQGQTVCVCEEKKKMCVVCLYVWVGGCTISNSGPNQKLTKQPMRVISLSVKAQNIAGWIMLIWPQLFLAFACTWWHKLLADMPVTNTCLTLSSVNASNLKFIWFSKRPWPLTMVAQNKLWQAATV